MAMGGGSGRGEVNSEINVTPMADVMLVLLIIFMVVTPLLQKSTSVDLAKTENAGDKPEADREDAVMVAVTRDGHFYLGAEEMAIEDIGSKVTKLLSNRGDKTVYVKSDARAKYGDVVEVVDTVRSAGVDKIGLITERVEGKKTEAAPVQ
ncbi:MAG TPA: biopolymer transporter ExbD [Terriglobia bacterium]|nr:biopolymer transporter ExbD [Terriglobia bacterium]